MASAEIDRGRGLPALPAPAAWNRQRKRRRAYHEGRSGGLQAGPSLDETTTPISDQVTMGRRRRLDVALPYRRDHPGGGSAPMPPFPELLRITFDASLKDQVVAAYDEWLQ